MSRPSYNVVNYITTKSQVLHSTRNTEQAIRYAIHTIEKDPTLNLYLWKDGIQYFWIHYNTKINNITLHFIENPEKRWFDPENGNRKKEDPIKALQKSIQQIMY